MKRQRENIRQIQRQLKYKIVNQCYTKYICKNNKNVLISLKEDKKKYSVLIKQQKEKRRRQKEHKINITLIKQQLQQLTKDQHNMEKELEKKYFQNFITQEGRFCVSLISSNLIDLKKLIFKEDFEIKRSKNQFPESKFYSKVIRKENIVQSNRKIIYQQIIEIHLFINLKNNKVKEYLQKRDKCKQRVRKNQDLYNKQAANCQELQRDSKKLENYISGCCKQKQLIEQYHQYFKTYSQLRQQLSQIQQSNNQYAAYQAQDEQLKQTMLGIFNELKQNIDKTEQMINEEINSDRKELNFVAVLENKIQEYKQVYIERNSLKEQNKEAISLRQEQELDQFQNQIQTIRLKLVGRIPQIDQLSQEGIQNRIDYLQTRISYLDKIISTGLTKIQDITKRRFDLSKKGDVLTKKIVNAKKLIEKNERSIVTERDELKQIELKFNQVKLESYENLGELIADLCRIHLELGGYFKKNDEIEIQKELENFISQLNQGGSNHINVSFEQYYCKIEQQLKKFEEEKNILVEKLTLIHDDLEQQEELSKAVKIEKQTIQKTIKKYRQQKERIKRRSQLFDLVTRN